MDAHTCHSGEQAIQLVKQAIQEDKPFQLLIIDWRLPGMDGLELVERLKKKAVVRATTEAHFSNWLLC